MGSASRTLCHLQEMFRDPFLLLSALLLCQQETRSAPGRVMPKWQELGSRRRRAPATNGPKELQGAGQTARCPAGRLLVTDNSTADGGMRLMFIHSPGCV